MKILVADDDRLARTLLKKRLSAWGFEIEMYEDGDSAWEALQVEDRPRLALLDWMMPGKDGVELCRLLKEEDRPDFVYRLILTGRTEKDDLIEALESGADDYIAKPFDSTELELRLRNGQRVIEASESLIQLNHQLEDKVKERIFELSEALEVANNASKMKSLFLANMSHEIRTPLNGILSYVELLLMSELDEEQRLDMETIQTSAHNLRTIINDVLDFSKIEAGKMLLDNQEFSLSKAFEEVTQILKHKFEEKNQNFHLQINTRDNLKVLGDRVRLQQMITNLLGNANKFCSDNGAILLLLEETQLSGRVSRFDISVSDTGPGIPKETQAGIFESFQQADNSVSRNYGGTGLGLAITSKLTETMGGEIRLKSIVGRGSRFSLHIPLEIVSTSSDELSPAQNQGDSNEHDPSQHKVLLAEDNELNQAAMRRLLEAQGYRVTTAMSGEEVLGALESEGFDIVLMDIQMPGMSGDQAATQIRNEESSYKNIPIIALTAHALKEHEEEYLRIGMNEVVTKPIDYAKLFSRISQLTSSGEQNHER